MPEEIQPQQSSTAQNQQIQSPGSVTSQVKNGTATGDWLSALPPDLRDPIGKKGYKSPADLAKAYFSMEKLQGRMIAMPAEDASPEERRAFYSKLGAPESADKYELKVADGAPVDQNLLGSFKSVAHEMGLTPTQAQKAVDWYTAQAQGMAGNMEEVKKGWEGELRNEWGWAYNRNLSVAGNTLATVLEGNKDHPFVKLLDETGLGNHPAALKFFYELGQKMGEDAFVEGDQGPSETDIEKAKEEKAEIMNDPKHPYWKESMAGHKDAVEKMRKLNEIIFAPQPEA